jgi:hypothetical protein
MASCEPKGHAKSTDQQDRCKRCERWSSIVSLPVPSLPFPFLSPSHLLSSKCPSKFRFLPEIRGCSCTVSFCRERSCVQSSSSSSAPTSSTSSKSSSSSARPLANLAVFAGGTSSSSSSSSSNSSSSSSTSSSTGAALVSLPLDAGLATGFAGGALATGAGSVLRFFAAGGASIFHQSIPSIESVQSMLKGR